MQELPTQQAEFYSTHQAKQEQNHGDVSDLQTSMRIRLGGRVEATPESARPGATLRITASVRVAKFARQM
ncbi:MAG TPA: hypothetical protein VN780_03855 [Candidatus Eisenbacteria bacterium]|nr:hypothetical protein [Candidatus Eisenbacteria bacterium]